MLQSGVVGRISESTRSRLVAAAEELFALQGVDVVSFREINQASGLRNAMAGQYHFQDRAGVLQTDPTVLTVSSSAP
jgi:DNA-binding transcriptional regulator YbjK